MWGLNQLVGCPDAWPSNSTASSDALEGDYGGTALWLLILLSDHSTAEMNGAWRGSFLANRKAQSYLKTVTATTKALNSKHLRRPNILFVGQCWQLGTRETLPHVKWRSIVSEGVTLHSNCTLTFPGTFSWYSCRPQAALCTLSIKSNSRPCCRDGTPSDNSQGPCCTPAQST